MSRATLTGGDEALSTLQALTPAALEAANEAVNATAQRLADRARDRTADVYNISAPKLSQFITVKPAPEGQRQASITLKVRAVPPELFSPRVTFVPTPVRIFGRRTAVSIPLAQVALKLYRGGTARVLKGYFPLRQRNGGALESGEKLRRRITARRDRLTGLRYVTFPLRFLSRLLPDLQREAGEDVLLEFSAAWRTAIRKRAGKGRRPGRDLRRN